MVELFETLLSETDNVSRTVLKLVLGNQNINFHKPIMNFASNRYLEAVSRHGIPTCMWETKEKSIGATNDHAVLDPIAKLTQ